MDEKNWPRGGWYLVGEVQNISLMFSTLVSSSVVKIELNN